MQHFAVNRHFPLDKLVEHCPTSTHSDKRYKESRTMAQSPNPISTRSKSTTGINFDARILAFLDTLRQESPVFQRRSRSEVVNMIIESYAAQQGTPINNEETQHSA